LPPTLTPFLPTHRSTKSAKSPRPSSTRPATAKAPSPSAQKNTWPVSWTS
jgi:hypothetical protein